MSRSFARLCTLLVSGGLLGVSLAGCPSDPVAPDAPMTDTGTTDGGMGDTGPGARCGDSTIAGSETCDDGNTTSGDGCSSSCTEETGWDCGTAAPSVCTEICGDGNVVGDEAGTNGCDDDNTTAGDGCSASCMVEMGYACGGEPSVCMPDCGDGEVIAPEMCDDDNNTDGDGCSMGCDIETGWDCTGTMPSTCTTTCGDSEVGAPVETCDDGGTVPGDGCSATCTTEAGWDCADGTCDAICGDGMILGDETCDDDNTIAGDGCSDTCQSESVCGDGLVEGAETCDDGDTDANDGCSDTCTVEMYFDCDGAPSFCTLGEIEPNEDGTPSTGGSTTNGNDFNATARTNADTNFAMIPLNPSAGYRVVSGTFSAAGDEDVYAVRNDGTSPIELTAGTWRADAGFGIGVACGVYVDGNTLGDTVLRIFDDAGTSVANNDDRRFGADICSEVVFTVPVGETVYVHVMDYGDNTAQPPYYLEVRMSPIVCGDGILVSSEDCDDGDTMPGDGCSDTCTVESGYVCPGAGDCRMITCGDGFRDGAEVCDDDNTATGDGCSDTCTVETGYACDTGSPTVCVGPATNATCATATAVTADTTFGPPLNYASGGARPSGTGCGGGAGNTMLYYSVSIPAATTVNVTTTGTLDRVLITQNACADTNCTFSTDAAPENTLLVNSTASTITRIVGVRPYGTTSTGTLGIAFDYAAIVCGDGRRIGGAEACDDGDTMPGDGCSDTCTIEPNFTCSGGTATTPDVCVPVPYIVTTITEACVDMTGATAVTLSDTDDGTSTRAALPFSFDLFADTVSHFSVSSNGFVGFFTSDTGTIPTSAGNATTVPTSSTPNGYIATFWDDLDVVDVSTLVTGAAGSRVFTIQWDAELFNVAGSNIVVQLQISEATGAFEMHYCTGTGDAARIGGSSATIAAENVAGNAGIARSVNTAGAVTYGTTAFLWTPNP